MIDLKDFDFFSFFDASTTEQLAEVADVVEYKAGDLIFREGDPSEGLYIIVDGHVEICKEDAAGKRFQIAVVDAGSYFGEFGILDGEPRSADARAQDDVILAVLSNDALNSLFKETSAESIIKFAADIVDKFRSSNAKYMEDRLRQERISVVGQMVGEIIHDYRNPFAVISLSVDFLKKKLDDPEILNFCGLISGQVDRMQTMTEELLEFSRGETHFNVAPLNVSEFLSHFELLNRDYLAEQKVELTVEKVEKTIHADSAKLLRVMQNLTNNAVDSFNGEEGTIRVEAVDEGDNISFYVHDNGPGIPPEIAPRIFEAFATFGKKKGTGLGMAITKNIVDAHQGEIGFETEAGKGTSFCIKLPVGQS